LSRWRNVRERGLNVVISAAASLAAWTRRGVLYRALDKSASVEELFTFNKTHGSSPLNHIPDAPVRAHLGRIADGRTHVWAAFEEARPATLLGFISSELGSPYFRLSALVADAKAVVSDADIDAHTAFIHEFVVAPAARGRGVGSPLARLSVDARHGIFGRASAVCEQYTTVHRDNAASRAAFMAAGYEEVLTYRDEARDRDTTVLRACRPT